jgi:hypothetical protein
LQRQSFWNAFSAAKKILKIKNSQVSIPDRLFNSPCDLQARVVGPKGRFLFVSEGFLSDWGTHETISGVRGVSPRTVQRHLSNLYRLQSSPIRGCRSEVYLCWKVRVAQRVRRSYDVEFLKNSEIQEIHESESSRLFIIGPKGQWFWLRTNIYYFDWKLSRILYRREYLRKLMGFLEVPKSEFSVR